MLDWLQKLKTQASQSPLRPRVDFYAQNMKIGSVEPVFMHSLALKVNADKRKQLLKCEQSDWYLTADSPDVTHGLGLLAHALRSLGLAGAWRNEQLAVRSDSGLQIGTIERGAIRPFGIATLAVHLVGQTADGRFWAQQRALTKPNDPGKWDTLMGGMVSAADTVATALGRETWEEAGLRISQLQNVLHGGVLKIQQPAIDGKGVGYVVEDIHWYTCTVPDGVLPVNQDGEVAQFVLMDKAQLLAAMQQGEFTLEAALIFASVLGLID